MRAQCATGYSALKEKFAREEADTATQRGAAGSGRQPQHDGVAGGGPAVTLGERSSFNCAGHDVEPEPGPSTNWLCGAAVATSRAASRLASSMLESM